MLTLGRLVFDFLHNESKTVFMLLARLVSTENVDMKNFFGW
jgi:hypothetical protein